MLRTRPFMCKCMYVLCRVIVNVFSCVATEPRNTSCYRRVRYIVYCCRPTIRWFFEMLFNRHIGNWLIFMGVFACVLIVRNSSDLSIDRFFFISLMLSVKYFSVLLAVLNTSCHQYWVVVSIFLIFSRKITRSFFCSCLPCNVVFDIQTASEITNALCIVFRHCIQLWNNMKLTKQ